MTMMRVGCLAAWVGLGLATACGAQVVPQSGAAGAKPMQFEVVSLREDKSPPGMPVFGPTPDGYRMTNMSLILPLLTAYVPESGSATFFAQDRIVGMPDWLTRDRYDVDAKISEADQEEWHKPSSQTVMLRAMLQAMFVERCKLAVHRETKETSVLQLVVGKSGPKFKETDPAAEHPGGITLPFGGVLVQGKDGVNLYGTSMASLATLLSTLSKGAATVVDRTGLTGKYDIFVKRPDPPASGPDGGDASSSLFSMFSLDDLGLKVQSGKSVVETLVIDHIERPSAN